MYVILYKFKFVLMSSMALDPSKVSLTFLVLIIYGCGSTVPTFLIDFF